jgi:hypothetical protein
MLLGLACRLSPAAIARLELALKEIITCWPNPAWFGIYTLTCTAFMVLAKSGMPNTMQSHTIFVCYAFVGGPFEPDSGMAAASQAIQASQWISLQMSTTGL